jgi:hypothetical protein
MFQGLLWYGKTFDTTRDGHQRLGSAKSESNRLQIGVMSLSGRKTRSHLHPTTNFHMVASLRTLFIRSLRHLTGIALPRSQHLLS